MFKVSSDEASTPKYVPCVTVNDRSPKHNAKLAVIRQVRQRWAI